MSIKVYVEGGGDSNPLRRQCRAGFREFFEKAGLKGRMPSVIPCGSRQRAYKKFCTAIDEAEAGSFIVLLVDSEAAVADRDKDSSWKHLRKNDNWTQPTAAADNSAQLMVQCMEAWFVADRRSLADYFGKDFKAAALPTRDVEDITKDYLEPALKQATKSCSKGSYNKGLHSFELLGCLDPSKVMDASHHAKRLIDTLRQS